MKRLISILLCLCLLVAIAPTSFADDDSPEEIELLDGLEVTEEIEEFYEDSAETEEPYSEGNTVYDLENEIDVPLVPEEAPPEEEIDSSDDDAEIYNDASYDNENAVQLSGAEYIPDEVIIKFKEPWQVPGKEKQLQHEIEKVEKVGFVESLGVYVVKVAELENNPNSVLNRLKNNKYIEYVEPNYTMEMDYTPNDPKYRVYQSALLGMLNAPAGWDIIRGSDRATIAVIDSGVAAHPDLPPIHSGYSAAAGLSSSNDRVGHGTNVAGVIGAIGDNGLGSAGLNWSASIMAVKVDDASANLTIANVAKGIIWAADNGAKIINLSLGSNSDSVTLRSAIDYAYNSGCAIFAAVGNAGQYGIDYPARYPNVMAVGSGNATSKVANSNYGPGLNIVAGSAYYTTTASAGYTMAAGTSFATPQVAALASLIWEINPDLTNDQVYELIQQGAKPLGGGYNEQTGYGLIDIGNTMQLALEQVGGTEINDEPAPESLPPETPQEARTAPVIVLTGFAETTLEYGQAYVEMGYEATDCKGVDLTSAVKVMGAVDIWTAGLYSVTYEVTDSTGLTARATRTVTVSPKLPDPPKAEAPKITIIGSDPIILHETSSTPYREQMARAVDQDGTDISSLVVVSGAVDRKTSGTYTLTYSVTSPITGLTSTATRNVRIVAPTQKKDPRTSYDLSGQAKQGGKVTHTGIVSSASGFMDLTVKSIDKNMTITVQLIDAATKKALVSDTFTAAGTKQYKVDQSKYELVVTVAKANGNSKYTINLLMPETVIEFFGEEEVPLTGLPQITLVGSNPIVLHIGGTPYLEQGARAVDFLGNDISDDIIIEGAPNTTVAGTYTVVYSVTGALGVSVKVTREIRILDPNDESIVLEDEIPLADWPGENTATVIYVVLPGDSLWNIALKVYGTGTRWSEIYEMNRVAIGDNPSRIYVGQRLTIKAR